MLHKNIDRKFYSKEEAEHYIHEARIKYYNIKKTSGNYWKIYLKDPDFKPKEYIKIAKDLCYPEEVILRLKNALSNDEASDIMRDARMKKGELDDERHKTSLQYKS